MSWCHSHRTVQKTRSLTALLLLMLLWLIGGTPPVKAKTAASTTVIITAAPGLLCTRGLPTNLTDIVHGSTWVLDVRAVGNHTFRVRKVIHSSGGPMGIHLHNSELVVVSEHPSESVLVRRVAPECSLSAVVRGRKYILFTTHGKSEDQYSLVGGPLPRTKKLVKSIKALLSEHYDGDAIIKLRDLSQSGQSPPAAAATPRVRLRCLVKSGPDGPSLLASRFAWGPKGRRRRGDIGRSAASISWFKNGQRIRRSSRIRIKQKRSSHVIRSILRIDRPTEGDNGAYQCKYRLLPPAPSSYKQQVQRRQLKDQQGRHLQGILAPRLRRRKLVSDKVVVASTFPPRAVRPLDFAKILGGRTCPIESYCLNGGTCVYYASIGELSCRCATGYLGKRCEQKDPYSGVTPVRNFNWRSSRCLLGITHFPC